MDAILSVERLSVVFDGFQALDGVDLQVRRGGVHALIGPNGAGKTTLLDAIGGRVRQAAGRVWLDGRLDLAHLAEHRRARLGIARKFQTPSVFPHLTVRENLELAAAPPGLWATIVRPLSATARTRIDEVCTLIRLEGAGGQMAGTLAHGQKQWLEIGMLLVRQPKVLLLDEPVAGMTGAERSDTAARLAEVARQATVLLVEHDMDFVRQVSGRVTVLHGGRVLCEGSMAQVAADPRVIASYLGREGARHAAG